MPVLMKDVIVDWAKRRSIDSFDDLKLFHKESLVQRAIQKYMDPGELQGQAKLVYESLSKKKRSVEPSVRVLREAFFLLYEPHVIVTTADSLNGLLESNCLNYITNVQIDEASQLPEHVLIRLLKTFPHAGFGLVGDVKQLPPHCDNELDGLLKKYGIGNTMRRASQKRMFPQSVLRHVYRCHPVTTRLLSNMIYDGHLISAIEENERNEFMRMRPDIWPNREFPILVINQEQKGYRMGTSVANDAEKTHVLRIVKCLTREVNGYQLKPDDIGIISFYRAQTSVLTEAFRGSGVKCGTIDTFQGSEREVMIVCCTNEKPSDFMQLGNRVNVAMSRARQATILIGNAEGLQCAKYWSKIVKNARENGCYIGDISKFGQNCGPDGNGGGDGSEVGDGPEEAGNRNRRHRGGRRDRDRKQNEDQQRKGVEEEEKPKTATQKRRERRQRAKKRENEQKAMINQAPVAKEAPKKSRPNQKQRQVLRQKEGKDKTGGASYANVVARAGRPIVIEMSPIIDGLLNMRIKSRK
uniref:AAA_12 domain-containing protein n=1 Tax=Caenorhabditis tropicalis TaxID=1561998 RepID=A0A1I7SZ33_9PELO